MDSMQCLSSQNFYSKGKTKKRKLNKSRSKVTFRDSSSSDGDITTRVNQEKQKTAKPDLPTSDYSSASETSSDRGVERVEQEKQKTAKPDLPTSDYSSASETSSDRGVEDSSSLLPPPQINVVPKKRRSDRLDSCCKETVVEIKPLNSHGLLQCPLCPFSTPKRIKLAYHMDHHSQTEINEKNKKEKSFQCLYCNYQTNRELVLKTHMKCHFSFGDHVAARGLQVLYERNCERSEVIDCEVVSSEGIDQWSSGHDKCSIVIKMPATR